MRRVKGSRGGLGGKGEEGEGGGSRSGWKRKGLEGGPGEGRKDGVTGSRETGRLKGGEETLLASPSLSLSLYLFPPSDIHTHTRARSEADTETRSHWDNGQRKSLLHLHTLPKGEDGEGRGGVRLSSHSPPVAANERLQRERPAGQWERRQPVPCPSQ